MNKIQIKFIKEESFENAKQNLDEIYKLFLDNPNSGEWFLKYNQNDAYESKDYWIDEIKLIDDPKTDEEKLCNSINVYNSLLKSNIPRYIFTDYRFWVWFCFEINYKYVQKKIVKGKKTTLNSKVFGESNRRGLLMNYSAEMYFLVELSSFNELNDQFYLTKKMFLDFPTIKVFQQIIYRNIGMLRNVRYSFLEFLNKKTTEFNITRPNDEQIRKVMVEISRIGSIRLIDNMSTDDILLLLEDEKNKIFNN